MQIVIPFKDFGGQELKYCLRGIEKFIDDPEVTIIGDRPKWIKNVHHIPFKDNPDLKFKERNIFQKLLLVDYDFMFFNDDHFLLAPFLKETYHYSGTLKKDMINGQFRHTVNNTIDQFGEINNYFRHNPMFIKHELLKGINVDWGKPWGYCIKSIYCHLTGIKGTEYPDLKIRTFTEQPTIENMIRWREYFSTGNYAINKAMINVLNDLYPDKSIYE